MAYQEYSPEFFECTVPGCDNRIIVTDQKTLHWYNNFSGGERPKGYDICSSCEALLPTLSVACLNKALCDGDHGCIGNGRINLMQERGRGTAYWFLMNGQTERPQMYPYCSVCKTGIVYVSKCRNVGCRGDGNLRCTGDKKQGLLFMGTQKGETFWPPKQCDACREFIKELTDQPTQCKVCLKYWVFGKDRQRFLVIEKPVSEFRIPERCDGCAALTEDQIKEVRRLALSQARSRQKKRELEQALKTTFGRRSLRKLVRESFVRAASRFFREPGIEQLEKAIMASAISRLSKSDQPYIGEAFKAALKAVGIEQTKVTRLLAKVLGGLTHGLVDEAVFVSSGELTIASHGRISDANRRIAQINAEDGGNIPLIKTFVQPW